MKFTKIELYGFKSFADRQVIEFGDGVTAIVGPNGCGKSNVADAIRWVLGEKSAKALRGDTMTDVIFNGSEKRKKLSYCEVTLYFDNSDRAISGVDYDEISFTRKLFGNGESEYYMNKQQCLQRDIVNNLREAGVAREGYTLIGQGKIDQLLADRPQDRRIVFEEATGIAEYRSQKNSTENLLEKTHANYLRLADKIATTETRLIPLEKQAEKAKRAMELRQELKSHEINIFISRLANSAAERNKILEKIKGYDEQTALRQSDYEKSVTDYENVLSEINSTEKSLTEMQEKLSDMRVSMSEKSGQVELFKERIKALQQSVAISKEQTRENERLINDKSVEIRNNLNSAESKKAELLSLSARAEEVNGELSKLAALLSEGEEQADINRKQMLESAESLSDININRGAITNEKENLITRKSELEQLLIRTEEKGAEIMSRMAEYGDENAKKEEEITAARDKVMDYEDVIRNNNERMQEQSNRMLNLRTEIGVLENREKWYRDVAYSYSGYNDSVKRLMTAARNDTYVQKKVKGTVAEIIKFDKKYAYAIQTALSGAEQSVVTDNPEDAKDLINYLKKNGIGRVKFLPVTSVKYHENGPVISSAVTETGVIGFATDVVSYDGYYENVIFHLFGNTLVVDNIENATAIANRYAFSFKIITLDGDVLSSQGTMSGGAKTAQKENALLANERLLQEVIANAEKKRADLNSSEKELQLIREEQEEVLKRYELAKDAVQELKRQSELLKEKQVSLGASLREVKLDKEGVEAQISAVAEKLKKVSAEYEDIESGTEQLQKIKQNASLNAEKTQEEYDKLREKSKLLTAESTDLQIKITSLRADVFKCENDNARLQSDIEELAKQNRENAMSVTQSEQKIEKIKQSEEVVSFSKQDQEKLREMRESIDKKREYYQSVKDKRDNLDRIKTQLREQLEILASRKHSEELSLTKLASDLENAETNIREQYGETYESAQRFRIEDYDIVDGKKQVARIKGAITQLGAINENAIEDSIALRAEFDEDVRQKEDIEKAELDLRNALAKIKDTMLQQFNEGFNKINENFGKIFKELFGGGRAMLEMDYTDCEDKLDAGVEIIAEPPGKKQKISLLSGGERTLTAIAILFAILRMRPMPFCVLDEIEAALDEGNVVRFTSYLEKFAKETQFIVITHKKQTMEAANALFGVTMQEKGVTRLVSVKLSDISIDNDEAVIKPGK